MQRTFRSTIIMFKKGDEDMESLTPLIGREQQRTELHTLLIQPEVRLLTLTGPGGIGKTRLAQQVLADVRQDFSDGGRFVSLAAVTVPTLVIASIAYALNLQNSTTNHPPLEYVKRFLHGKHFLLTLDNFEQVTVAAPLLVELLAACPALKILVTSRVLLHVQGEYPFSVPSLALPDTVVSLNVLSQASSIQLFVQRAQAIRQGFTLNASNARTITEICKRLDCLPLAIELAAARLKLLSPQALLARLETPLSLLTAGGPDLPERQQTIRNTIQWSYDLLTLDEQRLLCSLSVFVDGCTLESVEHLCLLLHHTPLSVSEGVRSLLDKSLLRITEQHEGEARVTMLEIIREFCQERLQLDRAVEQVREAHATCYYEHIYRIPTLTTETMYVSLKQEYGNIVSALEWLLEHSTKTERVTMVFHLARVVGRLSFLRGQVNVGRYFVQKALVVRRQSSTSLSPLLQAEVLYIAGWLACWQYEYEQAEPLLEEALALFRALDNQVGVAFTLNWLGITKVDQGHFDTADAYFEECVRVFREMKNQEGTANTLLTQGTMAFFRGNMTQAKACCEESLRLYRQLHDTWRIAANLHYLGWIASTRGAYEHAHHLSEESITLFQTLDHPGFYIEALTVFAYEMAVLGETNTARTSLEQLLVSERERDNKEDVLHVVSTLGQLVWHENDVATARALFEEGVTLFLAGAGHIFRHRWLPASCLEGLGEIALSQGHAAWTVLLFGVAEAVRTMNGQRNAVRMEQSSYEHALLAAHTQLGEERFAMLWTQGLRLTAQQALAAEGRMLQPLHHPDSAPREGAAQDNEPPPDVLTAREKQVLVLLAEGLKNSEIAKRLSISSNTVGIHVQAIYRKLGLSSRIEVTRYAIKHQVIMRR